MVDIRSATAEIRRGKKIEEEEETTGQKYKVHICICLYFPEVIIHYAPASKISTAVAIKRCVRNNTLDAFVAYLSGCRVSRVGLFVAGRTPARTSIMHKSLLVLRHLSRPILYITPRELALARFEVPYSSVTTLCPYCSSSRGSRCVKRLFLIARQLGLCMALGMPRAVSEFICGH